LLRELLFGENTLSLELSKALQLCQLIVHCLRRRGRGRRSLLRYLLLSLLIRRHVLTRLPSLHGT
jgi:hypothetical protein